MLFEIRAKTRAIHTFVLLAVSFYSNSIEIEFIYFTIYLFNLKFSDLICVRVVQSLAHKTLNIRGFSLPCKETLYPLVIFPHTPQLSVSDFFCLIGTFLINGIIPYVVFCDWFLPFNVMSSVLIFVVFCYHYFYGQRISHCTDRHINPPSPHLDIFYVYQLVDIWVVGTIWLV